MSPAHVLEPTYGALRKRLLVGHWPPGFRLEAVRLAEDLGVSITPIRDSLNRLTGERMIVSVPGDGFHVPMPDEADLIDLIGWHRLITFAAVQNWGAKEHPGDAVIGADHYVDRSGRLFAIIASWSANQELEWALANAAARLGPFRALEPANLPGANEDLAAIEAAMIHRDSNTLLGLLAGYHARRAAIAGRLVHAARSINRLRH